MLRVAANFLLYGGIAAVSTALLWPPEKPLDWRFYAGVTGSVLTAWKALMSKGGSQQEPVQIGPNDQVNVTQESP